MLIKYLESLIASQWGDDPDADRSLPIYRYSPLQNCRSFSQKTFDGLVDPVEPVRIRPTETPRPNWAPKWCFIGDTLVHTPTGVKAIREFVKGDTVIAVNTEGAELLQESTVIAETWRASATALVNLTIDEELVVCTESHPFYVVSRGWIPAGQIVVGDKVYCIDGSKATVTESQRMALRRPVDVWTLTVPGAHTFAIGARGFVVHNKQ